MDTSRQAYVAEDLVAHRLQQVGILVAKPKFDRVGTDLLGFIEMGDGVKFCRIQCKGRSVASHSANIVIPAGYVSPGFVVFLYVEAEHYESDLYCFFAHDIERWRKTPGDEYALSIPTASFRAELAAFRVDPDRLGLVRVLIQQAQVHGEFKYLSVLSGSLQLDDVVATGTIQGHLPP